MRLLCFHHAGGGAYGYRPWLQRLRPDVELIVVQLPGRENRRGEPLLYDADEVLDGLVAALAEADIQRYAMFGHSLGAHLAYRLTCRVALTGELAPPLHLFLSAAKPPRLGPLDEATFEPPTERDAIRQLKRFGGTPAALFDDQDLLKAFLPPLLADYEILYRLRREDRRPLDVPFTVFKGDEDPTIKPRHIVEWSRLTSAPTRSHVLPGGHFYPPTSQAAMLSLINAALEDYISETPADGLGTAIAGRALRR